MKMLQMIIRPEKLDEVMKLLQKLGVPGATAFEIKGFGRTKGRTERYRGEEMQIGFVPKVVLNIAVKADEVDKLINEVCKVAQTGREGDGKIFIMSLEDVVRIRTCERGEIAL